jgi:capsular exopolysaccharide synthesis family protein
MQAPAPAPAANPAPAATPAAPPAGGVSYGLSSLLATISDPKGGQAEAIRALRTHVMAQHIEAGRRALSVCATSRESGSTYVTTNLAVAMSQVGLKTLLIDGNLRQPGVQNLIRPPASPPGLAQCLAAEEDDYSGYIEAEVLPNLSVMYAGASPANPQELLAGDRFEALMNTCLRDFDLTIMDTPAANSCSDARRISSVLGYSMIVTRRDWTRVEDMKTLIDQLQADGAKVIGTVLEDF